MAHSDPSRARRPDRRRIVDSAGLAISVAEWGDEGAPTILAAHGGFDFAETMNVFAPLLADAGFRVVSWDQRGHGDSEWAALYSWNADVRDGAEVLASIDEERVVLLGHSKGGVLTLQLAEAWPHRVHKVVNLDGLPSRRFVPDVAEQRTAMLAQAANDSLDHRRRILGRERRPDTLEGLAERRGKMNPRLSEEWLRYLVTVGAKHDADGWRWKIDPALRMGGFGPWRPEWSMLRLPALDAPFLGVLGMELEMLGWGTQPVDVQPFLPSGARFETLDGVGHFVHIEEPDQVASMVLDFLS